MVGVVIGLLLAWYFLDLYDSGSDFFNSDFDDLDAVLFFGIAFLGVVPGLIKAIMGRKNSVRPLDVALSVGVLVVLAWFLYDCLSQEVDEAVTPDSSATEPEQPAALTPLDS